MVNGYWLLSEEQNEKTNPILYKYGLQVTGNQLFYALGIGEISEICG